MHDGEQGGAARSHLGGIARWGLVSARGLVGAGAVAAWGVVAFGWVWRAGGAGMSDVETALAFAALCVQTFAFHGGLAVLALAGVAVFLRMKWTAIALVPVLAWTLGPGVWSWVRPVPEAPSAGTPTLTVFSANLLYRNRDPSGVLGQIDRAGADVVVLQEFHPERHAGLGRSLRERYPHARTWPQRDAFGQAVFSAIPFEGEPAVWWGGEQRAVPQVEFAVVWEGARVAVWNVHTVPPSGRDLIRDQRAMVQQLGARAATLMDGDDAPDALILAGDFNAPMGTGHLREIKEAQLRDAHALAGRGRGATWPERGVLRHVPGIDLDHVVYRGELRCVRAWVGERFGSDHLPVGATFVVDRE